MRHTWTAGIRVLVIDDSVTIRAMMTRVLEGDPALSVVTVRSADEAEMALLGGFFDVVTLDVEMRGTNGLDYLPVIIDRHGVPVIMLSASAGGSSLLADQALGAGASGCFDKANAVKSSAALIRLIKRAAAKSK